MPYVMMPVPEEHVEAVMQFVLRAIARASVLPWDAESITDVFVEVDEASRSLLAFVARASVDDGELADADAARRLQLTVREVVGIMNEVNALARDANRPPLINARVVSERLANGRTKDKRVFQIDMDVAEFVRAAEKAELSHAPDPLGQASA
jgi:hypothetical protein